MSISVKDLKRLKGVNLQGYQKKGRFPVVPKERRTLGGIVFDSAAEMRRYADLQLSQRAGLISDLRRQVAYPVHITGPDGDQRLFCTYTADHVYTQEGVEVIEELKSSGTAKDTAYRLRRKAFELAYGLKVRQVVAK